MSAKNRTAGYVLIAHCIVAEVFAFVLLILAGSATEWFDWLPYDPTMTKMLAAALAALGVGSLLAARDPLRHRVIVQTEIVYTALSAIVLFYRAVRFPDFTPDFAWVIFAVFALFCVLFAVTYPRAEGDAAREPAASGETAKEPSPADR